MYECCSPGNYDRLAYTFARQELDYVADTKVIEAVNTDTAFEFESGKNFSHISPITAS